jgi:hypothetical protein
MQRRVELFVWGWRLMVACSCLAQPRHKGLDLQSLYLTADHALPAATCRAKQAVARA